MQPIIKNINKRFNVVLCSRSPRRKRLLAEMGLQCKVAPADIVECIRDRYFKKDIVTVSKNKVDAVTLKKGSIGIACDTIVVQKGRVFGKPKDRAEAKEFLLQLSHSKHTVYSCVVVKVVTDVVRYFVKTVATDVYFRKLELAEIEAYLDTPEAYDKAGAYGMQNAAEAFVKSINGCYYNVIGLPLAELLAIFKEIERK